MKKLLVLSAALLTFSSISFAASITSMTSDQAKQALSDKTVTTIPAATMGDKIIDNSFTGYFNKDGTVQGSFANKPSDTTQNDKGTWKVKSNGLVCVKWDNWENAKERCVTFYKLKNALLVIGPNGFETLFLTKDIKSGNQVG